MASQEKSPDYGVLQEFIESLFATEEVQTRLEIIMQAEAYGLNDDLLEIITLLPPGTHNRDKVCSQLNSSLSSHGWGYYYGTVH